MAKKNNEKAVEKAVEKAEALTADEKAVESAILALAAANLHHYVNAAIEKAGMAFSAEEHAVCKPLSAIDKAAAALAAVGVDILSLEADKAEVGKLAVSIKDIASCLGKYGKHCFAADTANGTSIVTHSITAQLVETGKATLAKTLDDARQYLPTYSSTGHFNTVKRLLKEHYALNVWQGGFSISSK